MSLNSCRWFSICVSPHLERIVRALAKSIQDFLFVFVSEDQGSMRRNVGWNLEAEYKIKKYDGDKSELISADLYIDNLRQLDVLEQRSQTGKISVYMGERWFKPPLGFLRVFVPSYYKMAKRFIRIFHMGNLLLFPAGIHAVRDMLRLIQFFKGDLRTIFSSPKIAFESRPGGRIYLLRDAYRLGLLTDKDYRMGNKVGFVQIPREKWNAKTYSSAMKNIFLGGYIVESTLSPSSLSRLTTIQQGTKERPFRILWAGRMLDWKRVDVLITAVCRLMKQGCHISLLIVGKGSERKRLLTCANGYADILADEEHQVINDETYSSWDDLFRDRTILFSPYLKNTVIQRLMRETIDLYVMPSDGGEGWGAVVSEAILANCPVVSTLEAGSSATLLPKNLLYPAKSVKVLARMLEDTSFYVPDKVAITWTGENYAKILLQSYKTREL